MLVTFSGSVGSGKSTAARHVVRMLEREGVEATYWRFQTLPCFTVGRPRAPQAPQARPTEAMPARRWIGYRRKRLTLWRTLGYVARIVAFRLFRSRRRSQGWLVMNRYFYDSFVHYELRGATERMFAALLCRWVPAPDLAILLVASPETVAARRPGYSPDYISSVDHAYRTLPERFPQLIEVRTDPGQPGLDFLETLISDVLTRARARACEGTIPGS